MTEELKPCPFCSGQAHMEEYITEIFVKCESCPARMGGFKNSSDADQIWNKRV